MMNLSDLLLKIDHTLQKANRSSGDVTLVAVSKLQPIDRVHSVLAQGQRVYGENYVQEAVKKWPSLQGEFSNLQLHMIGPLQGNKARQAFDFFDAIHTVDRISLAQKLAHLVQEKGRCPQLFVQVNIGHEPQKAGIAPEETGAFLDQCRALDVPIFGLMVIPPEDQDSGPHFAHLARLAKDHGLKGLSMGMSHDFETAIFHGATHIRVGSALFGERVVKSQ